MDNHPQSSFQILDGERGRGMYATRLIMKNELILSSPVAASALHRKHIPFFCQNCFAYSEDDEAPFEEFCEECSSVYYCSAKCKDCDASLHAPHCSLLSDTQLLKKEQACNVRLLLRMLSRCGQDSMLLPRIENMMCDHKQIRGFKRRMKQRKAAAIAFVDLTSKPEKNEDLVALLEENIAFTSKFAVMDLLARGPPNEFALFDQNGEPCGYGYFPTASLMNHSCVPSSSVQLEVDKMVFYAMRDIKEGEEILQSYCNIMGSHGLTRQENLEQSWGFVCNCSRCRRDCKVDIVKFDDANLCACGGVMTPLEFRGSRVGNCQCNSVNNFVL